MSFIFFHHICVHFSDLSDFSERKGGLWSQGDPSLNPRASDLILVTWGQ